MVNTLSVINNWLIKGMEEADKNSDFYKKLIKFSIYYGLKTANLEVLLLILKKIKEEPFELTFDNEEEEKEFNTLFEIGNTYYLTLTDYLQISYDHTSLFLLFSFKLLIIILNLLSDIKYKYLL